MPMFDLNNPVIIAIGNKARHTIARDLILEVNIWPNFVRMKMHSSENMSQFDSGTREDVLQGLVLIIELIVGGIEGNLLFLIDPINKVGKTHTEFSLTFTSAWIVVRVRASIHIADSDA